MTNPVTQHDKLLLQAIGEIMADERVPSQVRREAALQKIANHNDQSTKAAMKERDDALALLRECREELQDVPDEELEPEWIEGEPTWPSKPHPLIAKIDTLLTQQSVSPKPRGSGE